MFKITDHKGFQMTFANGYTVSVQWGPGNYTDDRSQDCDPKHSQQWVRMLAEVAAWDRSGKWVHLGENDDVLGFQSPSEVLAVMNKIAAL